LTTLSDEQSSTFDDLGGDQDSTSTTLVASKALDCIDDPGGEQGSSIDDPGGEQCS